LFVAGTVTGQKSVAKLLEQHNSNSIGYISIEELRMLQLNNTVVILDAREPEEFTVSHLKNAIHVGYNNFSVEAKPLQKLKKDSPIVVYCSLGIRSETIGEKLKKSGFTNVKNLYGGIFEWKNKGYPVFDTNGKETEKVHAFSKHWSQYLQAGKAVY
tara:strand:+ start:133 stop:603 length:471 start_codon:yes stop_codon:yes gene_type:complete